jgi:hypothetical protein
MIDIKSNIDHLDELAAQYLADDLTETGKDIRAAAADLKNLRDYAVQLERNINEMSAEIQTLRDATGDDIITLLDRRIDRAISQRLGTENTSDETVREIVKDMIRDGDVYVSLDYSSVELELSLGV